MARSQHLPFITAQQHTGAASACNSKGAAAAACMGGGSSSCDSAVHESWTCCSKARLAEHVECNAKFALRKLEASRYSRDILQYPIYHTPGRGAVQHFMGCACV
jgi:hypothetical protein